jgi:hypothetical protein
MWCEVASTVLYLKDFVPMARRPTTTPFEDWHGFQPDISHLRPFGCTAYARLPVETGGGKLAPRSIKCILIGYFGRDAYKVFDKSTGKTYHCRDVIFEEGIGHCTLSAQPVLNEGEIADHVDRPMTLHLLSQTQVLPLPTQPLLNPQSHNHSSHSPSLRTFDDQLALYDPQELYNDPKLQNEKLRKQPV